MGIAAYNRGSNAISLQIRRQYGFDCPEDRVKPTPKPRPADWGSKTYQKAYKYAEGLARYMTMRGTSLTEDDLTGFILDNIKCGKKTARQVASAVLEGTE